MKKKNKIWIYFKCIVVILINLGLEMPFSSPVPIVEKENTLIPKTIIYSDAIVSAKVVDRKESCHGEDKLGPCSYQFSFNILTVLESRIKIDSLFETRVFLQKKVNRYQIGESYTLFLSKHNEEINIINFKKRNNNKSQIEFSLFNDIIKIKMIHQYNGVKMENIPSDTLKLIEVADETLKSWWIFLKTHYHAPSVLFCGKNNSGTIRAILPKKDILNVPPMLRHINSLAFKISEKDKGIISKFRVMQMNKRGACQEMSISNVQD